MEAKKRTSVNTMILLTLGLFIALLGREAQALPAPDGNSVAVLASSVGFADPSLEEAKAAAQGFTVVLMSDAVWAATTTAEFATYKAIIVGDPTCPGIGTAPWHTAAIANRAVWSPAITGNIVVVGTDPTFHSSFGFAGLPGPDGDQVADSGIAFAAAEAGETGAYIALSCDYHDTAPGTIVDMLDEFGVFTVTGVGCYNDSHIVAVHPALSGLTNVSLSDWSCSVHEAFDSFPASFLPLAIAENIGGPGSLSFPDTTFGIPYIIARGKTLSPILCGNGVLEEGEECDDGNTTNGDGCSAQCTIEVPTSFCGDGVVDAGEECDDGNTADGDGCSSNCLIENKPPDCSLATASPSGLWPPNHKYESISVTGVSDPDGDAVVVTVTGVTQDEPTNSLADGNTCPDAKLNTDGSASVRAERAGNKKVPGNGRVYHLNFTADDDNGSTCSGVVRVCVPHDQGGSSTCVDDGPLFNSTSCS